MPATAAETRPAAVVLSKEEVTAVMARLVEVPVPEMVSPPCAVPLPMVELAREYSPAVKPMRVEVALAFVAPKVVWVNGN